MATPTRQGVPIKKQRARNRCRRPRLSREELLFGARAWQPVRLQRVLFWASAQKMRGAFGRQKAVDDKGCVRSNALLLITAREMDRDAPTSPLRGFAEAYLKWRLRGDQRRAVVLLTTGAMNPPHLGHIANLQQARLRLKDADVVVLAAWISPSGDSYLRQKFGAGGQTLDADFRIDLCRAVAQDADQAWIEPSAWEAEASATARSWIDFPQVCRSCQESVTVEIQALHQHLPARRAPKSVDVYYVCGSDHLKHVPQSFPFGVVVVPRAEEARGRESSRILWASAVEALRDVSSTKVREALLRRDVEALRQMLGDRGAAMLLSRSASRSPSASPRRR